MDIALVGFDGKFDAATSRQMPDGNTDITMG